jgi:hypothetical protein
MVPGAAKFTVRIEYGVTARQGTHLEAVVMPLGPSVFGSSEVSRHADPIALLLLVRYQEVF